MFGLPKLIVLIVLIVAAWYVLRWINGPTPRRRAAAGRPGSGRPGSGRPGSGSRGAPPMIEAEDLYACRQCGAYVAANAPNCGRSGCPR